MGMQYSKKLTGPNAGLYYEGRIMSTVTRLEWEACDAHNCHCDIVESKDGDMVNYEDYAALEQKLTYMEAQLANAESKCRELAAENARLKDAAEFATAPDMWEDLGGNVMRYQYQQWYADNLKSVMQNPATDAFLAEVRASALEYYANLFKDTVNMDVKHNQEFHKGTLYVADQLRKGAAL